MPLPTTASPPDATGACHGGVSALARSERSLEAVDRGDLDRVLAGEDGHVERDEIAEQDERDQLLERGGAAGGDPLDDVRAGAGLLGGELGAQGVARVDVGVLEE